MRRATLLCLLALLTTPACGGEGSERSSAADPTLPATSSSEAAPTSEEARPEPKRSDRGNIIKTLGQEGGFFHPDDVDASDPVVLSFAVDSITVDPECNSGFTEPPKNGHYIAINVRASTSPDYPPDMYVTFSEYDFHVIGLDGVTVSDVSGNAYSCLDGTASFPSTLGPGQQYKGTVVIDSPATTGFLTYTPGGSPTGWEWQF